MKRYTLKNLPNSTQKRTTDLRLTLAKSRTQYLWSAFKDLIFNETILTRVILFILLMLTVFMIFAGRIDKLIICAISLAIYYGRFFLIMNRAYSVFKDKDCFPVLTSEGPQNVISIDEERFVRVESPTWDEVKRISFYDDFLVIEMKKESKHGQMYMWADDMEGVKQAALNMWRNALDSNDEDDVKCEVYSETELNEMMNFIEDTFGECEGVLHETMSPDMHVDIIIIPPAEGRNFYTLCTIGVGAHRMNVPNEYRYKLHMAERAELVMYLPADWDMTEEGFSDERNYWPVRLMKNFARMPIAEDSWMAWGHSYQREGEECFAADVPYSSAVLLCPEPVIDNIVSCPLSVGKSVDFYQVFPLTHEELAFKIESEDESPTDSMLDYMQADRDNWIDYALSRFDYRKK